MINREVLTALGIATALSVTGCTTTSNTTTVQTQVTKQAEVEQQVDEATPTPTPIVTETPTPTPTPTPEPEHILEDEEIETIFENAADEAKFDEAVEAGEAITADEAKADEIKDDLASRTEDIDKTMYAVSDVNLRAGDSTDYEKVGSLTWAEEVHVTGKSTTTNWFRIERPDGSLAYVSNKYVSDTKPQPQAQAPQASSGNGNGNGGQAAPQAAPSGELRDSTGRTLSDRMVTNGVCNAGYEITGTLTIEGLQ